MVLMAVDAKVALGVTVSGSVAEAARVVATCVGREVLVLVAKAIVVAVIGGGRVDVGPPEVLVGRIVPSCVGLGNSFERVAEGLIVALGGIGVTVAVGGTFVAITVGGTGVKVTIAVGGTVVSVGGIGVGEPAA